MAENASSAAAFYSKLLGWRTEPWGVDSSYTIFSAARGPVAGVSQGTPGHWTSFIGADDVDASVAAAEKLGAKVERAAADIPETGRFSIVADPQGARFALFKPLPSEAPVRSGEPQPGEIVWHELMTSNPEAALKFYQELFGWQLISKLDMGAIGFYWVFGLNGVQMGGVFKPSQPMPPAWLAYTSVADADKTAVAVKQAGGRVYNGPMDVPGGGRIAQLGDPSGVMFAVHSMKKAAAAPPAASTPPAPKPAPPKPAAPKPAAAPPAPKPATPAPAAAPKPAAPKPVAKPTPSPAPAAAPKPAAAAPAKPAAAPAAPSRAPAKKKAAPKKKAAAKKKAAPKKKKAAPKKKAAARKKAGPRKKKAAAKRKSAARRAPAARKVAKPAKRKKDKKKDKKKSKKERKREKKNKKGRRKK